MKALLAAAILATAIIVPMNTAMAMPTTVTTTKAQNVVLVGEGEMSKTFVIEDGGMPTLSATGISVTAIDMFDQYQDMTLEQAVQMMEAEMQNRGITGSGNGILPFLTDEMYEQYKDMKISDLKEIFASYMPKIARGVSIESRQDIGVSAKELYEKYKDSTVKNAVYQIKNDMQTAIDAILVTTDLPDGVELTITNEITGYGILGLDETTYPLNMNKTVAQLMSERLAEYKRLLDEAVAAGTITQDQADESYKRADEEKLLLHMGEITVAPQGNWMGRVIHFRDEAGFTPASFAVTSRFETAL